MSDLPRPNPDVLIKNPETITMSFTQTAKGFWYVDRISATMTNIDNLVKQMDLLIENTLARLHKLNGEIGEL